MFFFHIRISWIYTTVRRSSGLATLFCFSCANVTVVMTVVLCCEWGLVSHVGSDSLGWGRGGNIWFYVKCFRLLAWTALKFKIGIYIQVYIYVWVSEPTFYTGWKTRKIRAWLAVTETSDSCRTHGDLSNILPTMRRTEKGSTWQPSTGKWCEW